MAISELEGELCSAPCLQQPAMGNWEVIDFCQEKMFTKTKVGYFRLIPESMP